MRRARTPPRPPLTRRAVLAVPDPAALAEVESFRRRHDPLSDVLDAHVTLVFPFASSLSGLQVATHVRRIASHWPVLPLRLSGVDVYTARWVHLRVARGSEALIELHDRLYRRVLAPFLRTEFDYAPHMTIGRAGDGPDCQRMLAEAKACFTRPIDTFVHGLRVIAVTPGGDVATEADIPLGT